MEQLTVAVMKYFGEISAIPRESGNEKGMQDYLINFAKQRNLPYYADKYHNVIIFKNANPQKTPIILQAHTDMVYVATTKERAERNQGIKLVEKDGWLSADGTSLGADDGIGVALILALLDSNLSASIEAVFTAEEETTMQGAYQIDVSQLKGRQLICLDGFESNAVVVSSASFTDFLVQIDQTQQPLDGNYHCFQVTVKGLLGGHSGFDIDKNRGNAHQLLAELLQNLPQVKINRFVGGHEFNVIPAQSSAVFATTADAKTVADVVRTFITRYVEKYPSLVIEQSPVAPLKSALAHDKNLLQFIRAFHSGVLQKDKYGNVEVSQNLSEIDTAKGTIKIGLRSNLPTAEKKMQTQLQTLCRQHDLSGKVLDTQPGFVTLPNSTLLSQLQQANPTAKIIKMHIGVECGVFQSRMKNLDTVIISPTILCAHSVQEKLDLASVDLTARWLQNFLRQR